MTALELRARADSAAWAMANRAWVQRGMTLLPGYVDTTRSHFGYEMGVADFIDSANASRLAINQWVESQTQHRIRDLFPEGSIEPSVRLVLANAIYFKGLWQSPFEESETKPATFHLNAHATISVPMMSQTHRFGIGTVAGGHLLELPYRGGNLSMLILLPSEVDGLPAMESRLGADSLRAWIASLREGEAFVLLPRFTSNKHFDLTHTLKGMGMPTAFSSGADFSGMDGRHDLHVGIVVHGAFVDVNEEGTEAAASTGATMRLGAERFGQMFLADHPFLFLIRDRETGCILFMGRVTDPRG
jgi:serpin B